MLYLPQHFQLRHQILALLTQAAQKGKTMPDLMAQIDALVDELEQVWQSGDLEGLELVKQKANALALQAGAP